MDKLNRDTEKVYRLCFNILIVIGIVMYSSMLAGRDIWYDEAYTFGMLRHGFGEMCRITAADVHPPLYYILLKLFTMPFASNMTVVKLFSMLCMLLILFFGGIHTRRIFNRKVSLCFMVLFLLFPFMLPYAVEMRMYSLAALFVLLSAVYGYYTYINSGRRSDVIKLVIFSSCCAYTHYFAFVSVCVIHLMLLIAVLRHKRGMLKTWLAAVIAIAVLYIPWLGCFISQLAYKISNEYWIGPVNGGTVLGYLGDTFSVSGSAWFSAVHIFVFVLLLIYMLCCSTKHTKKISLLALAVWAGTIALGVLVSILVRPVFVIRYSVASIPLMIIFAAAVLVELKPRAFCLLLGGVLLVSGIISYNTLRSKEYEYWPHGFSEELISSFDTADSYIIADADEEIKIEHFKGVLAYYEENKPIYSYRGTNPSVPFDNVTDMAEFKPEENKEVILMKKWNTDIPEELLKEYAYSYVCHVATDSRNNTMDIYRLVPKSF